jgi:hypothetical protein
MGAVASVADLQLGLPNSRGYAGILSGPAAPVISWWEKSRHHVELTNYLARFMACCLLLI